MKEVGNLKMVIVKNLGHLVNDKLYRAGMCKFMVHQCKNQSKCTITNHTLITEGLN